MRQRIVDAYERGDSGYETVTEKFRVSVSSVRRLVTLYRERGHLEPDKKAGGTRSNISLQLEAILAQYPDANAVELTAAYHRGRRGKDRRHVSSIKRAMYRGGHVVKKRLRPLGQLRPDVAVKRDAFLRRMHRPKDSSSSTSLDSIRR
ncbi:MAG: hypothetical protein NZX77_20680 [Polyangiaceae bacterium]|nr:hypothetical protein [Polyangiaceae bacterium]